MFKWGIKPDTLPVFATFRTQVLEMLRYIFVRNVPLCCWLSACQCFKHSGVTIKGRRVTSVLHHYVISQHWEPNTCLTESYAIGTHPSSTQLEKHKNSHTGNIVQYNTHIWILLIHKHHTKLCNWINFNTQKLPRQLLSVSFKFVSDLNFDVNISSCIIVIVIVEE